MELENAVPTLPKKTSVNLNREQRRAIYEFLLVRRKPDGKLSPSATSEAAVIFKTSVRTVQRLWKKAEKSLSEGKLVAALSPNKKGRCGRKRKELDPEAIRTIPLIKRKTIRSLAAQLGVPSTRVFDRLKEKKLRRHTSSVRPALTEANKLARVEFCKAHIVPESIADGRPKFGEFLDVVHVDEKWFYITEETKKIYMLPDEPEPDRKVKSKRFIEKVMFLAEVARPRPGLFGHDLVFELSASNDRSLED